MILADTSIWLDHIRRPDIALLGLLKSRQAAIHITVIGELAAGNLPNRAAFLYALSRLRRVRSATNTQALKLLETERLWGTGIGWPDVQILASCHLTATPLWTRDQRLFRAATRLGLAWQS